MKRYRFAVMTQRPLRILPLVFLLFACGPQLQRPAVNQAMIESERVGQMESALKLFVGS